MIRRNFLATLATVAASLLGFGRNERNTAASQSDAARPALLPPIPPELSPGVHFYSYQQYAPRLVDNQSVSHRYIAQACSLRVLFKSDFPKDKRAETAWGILKACIPIPVGCSRYRNGHVEMPEKDTVLLTFGHTKWLGRRLDFDPNGTKSEEKTTA